MTRKLGAGLAAVAVIGAVLLWGQCRYRAGAADQALRAAGAHTDTRNARLIVEVLELEARVRHDSAVRVRELAAAADSSAAARGRSDSLETMLRASGPLPPDIEAVLDAKNATIAQQGRELAAKDRTILFWQGVAATNGAQRDSALAIAGEYRRQRDAWRERARPRCTAGVAVIYGLNGQRLDGGPGFTCQVSLSDLWPF